VLEDRAEWQAEGSRDVVPEDLSQRAGRLAPSAMWSSTPPPHPAKHVFASGNQISKSAIGGTNGSDHGMALPDGTAAASDCSSIRVCVG